MCCSRTHVLLVLGWCGYPCLPILSPVLGTGNSNWLPLTLTPTNRKCCFRTNAHGPLQLTSSSRRSSRGLAPQPGQLLLPYAVIPSLKVCFVFNSCLCLVSFNPGDQLESNSGPRTCQASVPPWSPAQPPNAFHSVYIAKPV